MIESAFSVPVLREQILDEDYRSRVLEYAKCIVEENPDGWGANWASVCQSWNSTDIYQNILLEEPELEKLTQVIVAYVQEYSKMWGMIDADLILRDSWINACKPNNFQECHDHDFSYISGVYYIDVPENSGDFIMDNPLCFEWQFKSADDHPYSNRYVFSPERGDLILFPSNIQHQVGTNESDEMRYSLAFNVGPNLVVGE